MVGKLDFEPYPPQPAQPFAVISAAALSLLAPSRGVLHCARTGSAPSLVAGLCLGGLYSVSYYRQKHELTFGEETALLASAVWTGTSFARGLRDGLRPASVGWSALAVYGVAAFGVAVNNKRIASANQESISYR
ncbi:hypothetical protein ASPZODRAFT_69441 [Penicilliopsis zonata CBS 506.65]|uniref:Uncharacterized protein n=1 Tax=Penicilliopsis zonata CBS 506.65 TaxID=1073090 RepID=A0A1L9SDW0_9EURO|nr:hypothetical protein ASPZODRAFT_69441 [Penicilliopsis zonata CBS 506.65]OJJ45267.1 hypothetical protein ASPZODRAFT_69441 [Penicilliopsis zonata CBS 506.65]